MLYWKNAVCRRLVFATALCGALLEPGSLSGGHYAKRERIKRTRKMHSDIWQFRWREQTADGRKIYPRRQIGTIDQIPDIETARKAASLVPDSSGRIEAAADILRSLGDTFGAP